MGTKNNRGDTTAGSENVSYKNSIYSRNTYSLFFECFFLMITTNMHPYNNKQFIA